MANIGGGKEHESMGEQTSKQASKRASKQAKERVRENESTLNVLKDNESWSFAHLAHFAKDLFYEFNSCMIKGQIDQ